MRALLMALALGTTAAALMPAPRGLGRGRTGYGRWHPDYYRPRVYYAPPPPVYYAGPMPAGSGRTTTASAGSSPATGHSDGQRK